MSSWILTSESHFHNLYQQFHKLQTLENILVYGITCSTYIVTQLFMIVLCRFAKSMIISVFRHWNDLDLDIKWFQIDLNLKYMLLLITFKQLFGSRCINKTDADHVSSSLNNVKNPSWILKFAQRFCK